MVLTGLGACDSSKSVVNPVANAGPDQTVGSGAAVTLDGGGSTGTGTLSYSWSQTAGTTVTLSSATAARPTFTAPAVTADEVLTFQLTITDQNNLTATDSVNVTVVDGIPTADAGPDQTVIEGAAVTLDGSGSVQTNGGTIVSYAWAQTGGPAVANLAGTDTTAPTFDAPSVAMDEVVTFELTVTDDNGDTDTDSVAITVQDDTAPVANAGPDQAVDEGTDPVTLDGSGSSDAVGSIATYAWSQTAGTAVVLTGGNTVSPTFAAPQVGPGGETLTFELTVTDDAAQTDTDTVDVVVNNVNAAPTANAGPDQSIAEGVTVNLDGTGSSDSDGSITAYAWTQTAGPTVTLNNDTTATPSFTAPLVAAQATLTFELTVTDDLGAQNTDAVDIVINSFNVPPTANAGPDQTVTELTPVNLDGSGSADPDGAIATYAWTQTGGPGVTLTNGSTPTPSFTAPDVTIAEILTFQLTVTDNNPVNPKQGTDTVEITVEPPNAAPVANAGPDQTVNEQTAVNLDGTGSTDSDGTVASYAWAQTAGTGVTLTGGNTATPTFTAPSVDAAGETLTFELTVTDDDGDTNTDTVDIQVDNDPSLTAPPTAVAGADQVVSASDIVTLNGASSSDSDGTITAYQWTQTSGPTVTLNNANTAVATFTAPAAPATLVFQLEVTDNDAATGTDSITVRVNAPPTADAGADQTVAEASTVTLDGTGSSDSDGTVTGYQWTQTGGTPVTITNATTSIATFTAPAGPATLTFQLEVTDNDGATNTATTTVTVNARPTANAGPDQSVDEQSAVSLNATGSSDVDGTITGYSWTQTAGSVVSLTGATTATPSFTAPSVSTSGETLTFEVTVTDNDGATDTDTVDIQVNNDPALSDPPTAVAGPDQVVLAGVTVTLDGSASTDTDGTITGYQWTQTAGPTVTLTNANTAVATFTAPAAPATLTFQLEVTDNDSSTGTDTIQVRVNAPPTASAGPDQSVNEQSTVNLTAVGSSDVDGSIAGYSWTQTAGTAVVINNPTTATPSFTAPSVSLAGETLTFEVEVTDDDGATDTDTVDIQVDNDPALNIPPTAVAGPDQNVGEGVSVTLDGSGSSDDTLITGYQWTQTAGTTVTLTNANQAVASFTSPTGPATLTFQLEVTDEEGGTATDQVDINVSGTVGVTGKVTFDFVPHVGLGFGGLDYGNITQRPARLVTVQVIDAVDDTTVIATTSTDTAGDYSFTLDPNIDVFLRVRAEMINTAGAPSWDFTVVDNTNSDALYVLDTTDINTGVANQTLDINAATVFDGNDYTVRNGGIFSILDTTYDAFQMILATDPTRDFVPLKLHWSINNTTVSGDTSLGEIGTSFYRGGNPIDGLYLLGQEDVDTEEYDKHVIAHEFGHYVDDTIARSDSIGGAHTLTDTLDKRVAFGEGFANAWSAIATADVVYIDTLSTNQAFAGGFNVEDGEAFAAPNGNAGWYNERSVQEVIYDLYDSTNEGAPEDSLSLGFGPIYSVFTNQQVTTTAFTSIFSFVDGLKDDRPGDAAAIDAMTGFTAIALGPVADEYGTGETNAPAGDSGDTLPIYKTLTVNGGAVNVCSNDSFGGVNKLNTIQFIRVNITTAGQHTFNATATVIPMGQTTDPDMWLRRPPSSGIFEVFESQTANSESGVSVNFLSTGEWILEVFDFNNRGSRKLLSSVFGGPSIGRACFDITVTGP